MRKKQIPVNARKALAEGNIGLANDLLKELYSIRGIVMQGQQLGRTLGFPTANLKLNSEFPLFLANGVYAVFSVVEGECYKGMANIGIRPTLDQHTLTIEVNVFEFSADIYGREMEVFFVERLRDEQKFPGLTELRNQIILDRERTMEILSALDYPYGNPV